MCGAPDQATISRDGIPTGETVVQGLVYNGDSPVSGGYVRLLDGTGEFTAEVVTSATGQFRFFARPGSWTVRVIPGGGHSGGDAKVDVAAGEISEVRISV
ncbi:MAG TPA: DUF1416 domain-containing protein [Mycobacteriales bacterium]|jgi:hypothetical protein|nr:DUF1416 domain-containing protein [Mycobacteriales bacterium]HVX69813.1 DUF1416 domain-containing protein [Mycobacteriales bacterium]